ncbi:hypothetical protein C0J52_10851 [Blattella germanica]|nr:hypothetical protein C0J52_10851 [Blattella germanica]
MICAASTRRRRHIGRTKRSWTSVDISARSRSPPHFRWTMSTKEMKESTGVESTSNKHPHATLASDSL